MYKIGNRNRDVKYSIVVEWSPEKIVPQCYNRSKNH